MFLAAAKLVICILFKQLLRILLEHYEEMAQIPSNQDWKK